MMAGVDAPTLLTGRVVTALAAEPITMERTGSSLYVTDLAKEYGISDEWVPGLDVPLREFRR